MSGELPSPESLIKHQEQQILLFENQEGIANLIEFADSNEHLASFVQSYQTLIRTNPWPFSDDFTSSFNGLVYRFYQTSLNYVANATTIYRLLKGTSIDDTYLAFEIAVFSEAARGREGKRSKIGLDNLQNSLITELMAILRTVWTRKLGDMEDAANTIVQTVMSGHSSATELPENYLQYIDVCDLVVTKSNFQDADAKADGLVRKLLREFCCYSLVKFNRQLSQYRAVKPRLEAKKAMISAKRSEKIELTERITNRIDSTGGNTSRFIQLIQQIDHLNFLNDNIDVKFSFKSWPGLIHWNAFDRAMKFTRTSKSILATAHSFIKQKNTNHEDQIHTCRPGCQHRQRSR